MEKTITVGGISFPARSSAASFLAYKHNFNRDALRDMMNLVKGMPEGKNLDAIMAAIADNDDFDLDIFFRFAWIFAKAADPKLPPLVTWLDGFDISPIDFLTECLEPVMDLLLSNIKTSVAAKNMQAAVSEK